MAPHRDVAQQGSKVCVIGAGPLGLMAVKNMKEAGLDVTCFEARSWIGGIWKYSDDESLSVASTTIFNSSKYRSAISDYPFPADADDFPTWRQMWEYMQGYADHFQLSPHIQLNTRVTHVSREGDAWVVELLTKDGSRREYFDRVAVANGSFTTPKQPKFPGTEEFTGRTLHAIDFHHPETFQGQRVLLVGLHASAQDVAVGLSGHAAQLYASHRNGVVLLPRYDTKGAVLDTSMTLNITRFCLFATTWFPNTLDWLLNKAIVATSKAAFPNMPKSWNFLPAPSIATTAPLIADEIYPLLESGFCEPVAAVSKITGPKTIELKDGRTLNDIDAIIYTTGYDLSAPFLEDKYNPHGTPDTPPRLYRGTFPLHEDSRVRNSLAFLGHGAVAFPGFVQHELVTMAVSQIWSGNSSLPPLSEMQAWYRGFLEWRQEKLNAQKSEATFYTLIQPLTDHLRWMDSAAGTDVWEHFGWFSRKAWSFWWNNRKLYNLCANGVFTPTIWRLFESGKRKSWHQAKEQIVLDNEAAQSQVRIRLEKTKLAGDKKTA
ncbi:hypothetical protein KVR01_000278 [Diaporthe batatas]|uniref:uncharacterized protein n=1 Tax=Diaporthe batatas TaxID=748121 RepID=UPI001D038ED5|nr:uncharacterized protein KVR01_000278 [Diaporthe batatas]KAG8169533.1 hypothetical protein KVR01_000278 [Diaporthe batatas]